MQMGTLKPWLLAAVSCVFVILLSAMRLAGQQLPTDEGIEKKPATRLAPISSQANLQSARRTNNKFQAPVESAFQPLTELRLATGTFASPHAAGVGAPEKFELLCYNGLPVGPTIRVRRGATFRIHLKNDLPINTASGSADTTGLPPNQKAEAPFEFCVTNLHTHGLHISPDDPSDNIYRQIKPGHDWTFEYHLPKDHPAGTFWYHPHKHGSVAYQLSNGLAGALIVEGTPHDGINDLEDLPEIAAAKERILVFQLYNYRVGAGSVARIDAGTIYNVKADAVSCGALAIDNLNPAQPKTGQATAINGVINPTIVLAPGEIERWRLIHAAWDADRQLSFVDDADRPTRDLKMYEIAVDGLATGRLADKSTVEIAPGQRSDVLVQAPLLPAGVRERVYHLKQSGVPGSAAPHGLRQDPLYLAKVVIVGPPRTMKLPDPQALARCRPFGDIRDEELAKSSTFPDGIVFAAFDGDANHPPFYTINDTAFHNQPTFQIRLGTAEEWTLTAKVSSHPFHIHVNPFQVVAKIDPSGKSTLLNAWRDTLYIKEGESYRIRSRFQDFTGKTVFHCHILDHEDQGMTMPLEFIPANQTPVRIKAARPPKLQTVRRIAPALRLPDTRGLPHDLSEFRGRTVVLVFVLGLDCPHCVAQLRDLLRTAREAKNFDAQIVAVSSEAITPSLAASALPLSAADRFQLLVDPTQQTFRVFGCSERGDPQHGLFVIDRAGVIRAAYTGPLSYDDPQEVIRRVRSLSVTLTEKAAR